MIGFSPWIIAVGLRIVRLNETRRIAALVAVLLAWPFTSSHAQVDPIRQPSLTFKTDQRSVRVLAFSPDGQQIALAGDDGVVEVWDVSAARRLRTLKGSSQVFTVSFSPDGRQLATSDAEKKINVWQLQGDELPSSFDITGGPAYSIGYTSDGKRIAAGCRDGVIRLYSTDGGLLHSFGDIVSGISVIETPAGARIAGLEGQGVRMWDAETGELVLTRELDMSPWLSHHLPHVGLTPVSVFQLSPDAGFVAAAGDPEPGASPPGLYRMTAWNTVTGKTTTELGVGWPVYVFSHQGDRIAVSSLAGISVIDIETWKERHRYFAGEQVIVRSLVFSPDAKWIASGDDHGLVRIWKVD
jgi:WD40 repeat protein